MDVYAFSLIMWEACRRTEDKNLNIIALPYEIPYHEYVPREPLSGLFKKNFFLYVGVRFQNQVDFKSAGQFEICRQMI
jgi:hypothetical protein